MSFFQSLQDALWRAVEEEKDQQVRTDEGMLYDVHYVNTPRFKAGRAVIHGRTWASQNLNKRSRNTIRIKNHPGLRISFGYKRQGGATIYEREIESRDGESERTYVVTDLTNDTVLEESSKKIGDDHV